MIIGSHVHFDSKTQLFGSTKEALSYGANTFMYYTGAPQNTIRSTISDELTDAAIKLMLAEGINPDNVICHAPYIINTANNLDESKYLFSQNFLRSELDRCEKLKTKYLVLHPGASVGIDKNTAINNTINALNNILNKDDYTTVLIETMAGKGTEIGINIDEIKRIIKGVKYNIGVCLDTCHLSDSGVDLKNFDTYLEVFDEEIGLDKIKCIHINDSKNSIGMHKDRHENIGYGYIGFEILNKIVHHDKLKDVPKILETPYIDNIAPYKYEIDNFKNNEFKPYK